VSYLLPFFFFSIGVSYRRRLFFFCYFCPFVAVFVSFFSFLLLSSSLFCFLFYLIITREMILPLELQHCSPLMTFVFCFEIIFGIGDYFTEALPYGITGHNLLDETATKTMSRLVWNFLFLADYLQMKYTLFLCACNCMFFRVYSINSTSFFEYAIFTRLWRFNHVKLWTNACNYGSALWIISFGKMW